MVNIAYVVNHFGMGGLERCVVRLVNHLDRSQFRTMIIVLGTHSEATEWLKVDDVPIFEFRKDPGNSPKILWKLMNVLYRKKIDIVHSHNWGTLLETVIARRCAGIKCHIHAERGTVFDALRPKGFRRRLRGFAMRWALSQADSVVAVTEATRSRVVALSGVPPESVKVIPNGVNKPSPGGVGYKGEGLPRSFGIEEGAVIVGSIGRLHPVKDFKTAVEAVAQLVQRGRDVHLILVGEGSEKKSLEKLAKDLRIGNRIHCVGRDANVGVWLMAMDIYVNSSVSEGMSQALLEAMAMGLPVVATDVGDHAKVLRGNYSCGVVVPVAKPKSMADALEQLIVNKVMRTDFGKEAQKNHEENFSVGKMIHAYEDLYLKLWSNGRLLPKKSSKLYKGEETRLHREK